MHLATAQDAPALPAALADLRDIPLAEMPALSASLLGMALQRVLPDGAWSVPVSAFQSAI